MDSIEELLARMERGEVLNPDAHLDSLADEVIRRWEADEFYLATLSPEQLEVEKAKREKQDAENFVNFMMNDSFGGP